MYYRAVAKQIFLAGVNRVLPGRLMNDTISVKDNYLHIHDLRFNMDSHQNIFVIGAGKASAHMGAAVEKILGERITGGHIVVKYGHSCGIKRVRVTEAGHPIPDRNGFMASLSVLDICTKAKSDDLVIALISGGGSALLSDFPEGSSPEEMVQLNNQLVNSGASIREINIVRKHLSKIKGGQLARAVYPGTLVSLILSDVTGDPLDVIASGPTVRDPSTFLQAREIIFRYDLSVSLPPAILAHINEGVMGNIPETPKPGEHIFDKVFNVLTGNNKMALEAARDEALGHNLSALIINDRVEGDIADVSEYIVGTALKYQRYSDLKKPLCLLFGGEPTVKMTGKGAGGRNQHLTLLCAKLLGNHPGITILSAGSDGTDGPTSAAGAVVDSGTLRSAISQNIKPEDYLRDFNSFNFFRLTGGHIITGPTMTNVMDIVVVLIW